MDENTFKEWLAKCVGLKEKPVRDYVCRLHRVSKLIDIDHKKPTDELLLVLERSPEFQELTTVVRSQLRRTVRLYRQFLDS